jgi:hypothetical protein
MSSFAPATRTATKARIALCGPSGSGKTYTGLAIGTALGGKLAVIDSERGSASKYVGVNGWAFDTNAPSSFSPDALTALLAEAGQAGYGVVLVDSLSHYWMGIDGMLEQVDRRSHGSNTFSGWKDARPLERRMVDALIAYPGHVIVTMRTKTEYVIEEDSRGKKIPRKVGLKPEQREGIEYEFDLVGDLDQQNVLTVSKSRLPDLSGGVFPQPGVDLAKRILSWLEEGVSVPDAKAFVEQAMDDAMTPDGLAELGRRVHSLGLDGASVIGLDGKSTTLRELMLARYRVLTNSLAEPKESADA